MLKPIVTIAALAAGGFLLSKKLRKSGGDRMSSVQESIDVNVPVRTAYNQWTQFEEFPRFMHGVKEVRQLDDTHLHWRADVGGKEEQWEAEITEQIPGKRIAWHSIGGVKNGGVVTFHKLSDGRTRVMLQMDYEPRDALEGIGSALGVVQMEVRGNLQRFKDFLESRGTETGAWSGTVEGGQKQSAGDQSQSGQAQSRSGQAQAGQGQTAAGQGQIPPRQGQAGQNLPGQPAPRELTTAGAGVGPGGTTGSTTGGTGGGTMGGTKGGTGSTAGGSTSAPSGGTSGGAGRQQRP
jgi:uncharacterized membrane protein